MSVSDENVTRKGREELREDEGGKEEEVKDKKR